MTKYTPKFLWIALVLLSLFLWGCAIEVKKSGFSAKPVTPPANSVVRFTFRNIGIHAGQNPATQTPEVNLGYQSVTFDRVPAFTTNVFVPRVKAGIGVDTEGLGIGIKETFEVGERIPGKECEKELTFTGRKTLWSRAEWSALREEIRGQDVRLNLLRVYRRIGPHSLEPNYRNQVVRMQKFPFRRVYPGERIQVGPEKGQLRWIDEEKLHQYSGIQNVGLDDSRTVVQLTNWVEVKQGVLECANVVISEGRWRIERVFPIAEAVAGQMVGGCRLIGSDVEYEIIRIE